LWNGTMSGNRFAANATEDRRPKTMQWI
jgi:hypothetical protein